MKKKEWAVYHNIGFQHDAERFSLIDSVLDSEYDNSVAGKKPSDSYSKSNLLVRIKNELKTKR